jgi:chromosome segregation ATPase
MDWITDLPLLADAPALTLLAIVALALAWALIQVLSFLPRIPALIVEAVNEAGDRSTAAFKHTVEELQDTIRDLQRDLHEERDRVDDANAEILSMKRHMLAVDADRRQALRDRDEWKDRAFQLELVVKTLEAQVERLNTQVRDLTGRLPA